MAENVVVIGAGAYGAAVAASLARRGARVVIVEAGAPAGGTSGATFAWINASSKQSHPYHAFGVAAMDAHRRLAAETPAGDWYHESGNLRWETADDEHEVLRRKVATVVAYGYEVRWLSRAEALKLEPDVDPAALPADEIAYFPREGWVEPARLVGHLLSRAVSRGAELVTDDPVVSLRIAAGLVRAVGLASGRSISAGAVVNCAGPRAGAIAGLAGLDLPMRNTHGVLVHTSPVTVSVSRVIHAPDVHLRPDGGGRLLLHTQAIDGAVRISGNGEMSADGSAVETILEASRVLYPGIRAATVEKVRIGERPIPGDGLPVLGRAAELPNFHFAVSHSGVTLSVHAGDLVAAEVTGEDRGDELAAFRFERFHPAGAR
ncbi:FAD-dependent oxidoreductase [Frankia sp. Hr75.2]|nr:FAD-dependent oxidoreductase [Frankia sp. Hr75.2]